MAITTQQQNDLLKQAQQINSTFQNVKGSLSQSDISTASAGVAGASNQLMALDKPVSTTQPEISGDELTSPPSPLDLSNTYPQKRQFQSAAGFINPTLTAIQEQEKALETAKMRRDEEISSLKSIGADQSLFSTQEDLFAQFGITPELLKEKKDIGMQLAKMQEESELMKARIAGAAGQTISQGQREITQEDREFAIRSAGLAARAAVIDGNIETARGLVKDMMDMVYADRKFEYDATIQQINAIENDVDDETAELLRLKKEEAEAAKDNLKRIQDAVDMAVQSGASQQEIQRLGDPTLSDEERLSLAQSIVARRASEEIGIDNALKSQQLINAQLTGQKLESDLTASIEEPEVSAYQQERASRTISQVNELLNKISGWTVGKGSLLKFLPETDARNFNAELDVLKSNIAFGELTAMREASKTGGALGQVSDREGKLLESALGALDQLQEPEEFKKNLNQVKDSISRWQEAMGVQQQSSVPEGTTHEWNGVTYKVVGNEWVPQ